MEQLDSAILSKVIQQRPTKATKALLAEPF